MKVVILTLIFITGAYFFWGNEKPIKQSHNWAGEPIKLTVYYTDNIDEKYKSLVSKTDSYNREGFSIWYPEDKECVVYSKKPRSMNDSDRFVTLGHELLHCTDGSFHSEK